MTREGVGRRGGGRKTGYKQIEKRRLTYRDRQRQTWRDTRGGDRHRDIETDRCGGWVEIQADRETETDIPRQRERHTDRYEETQGEETETFTYRDRQTGRGGRGGRREKEERQGQRRKQTD